jgi:hypothetical protein
VPPQWVLLVAEHSPHAPDGWQTGRSPPHSPSAAQARQARVARSQTGVAPPHCAFDVQATQRPAPTSQAGVVPVQRVALVAEHWPQAPPGWQAGLAPPHSPSTAQARQTRVVASQTGVAPPQFASERQATQAPVLTRQSGVAPVHSVVLVLEHWAQIPLGWQAGVVPPHSASPEQPRHEWKVGSHWGAAAGQSASARHDTQLPAETRQSGFAPVHWAVLPAEHWPQAPEGWQAGVAPLHSPSPAQARQTWAATLQTGVVPPHSASALQLTQVPVATLQAGIDPLHFVLLVAEQTPHAPEGWQAGVAPPQSPSPPQARQVWLVPSQIGVAPLQSALARQATQLPEGAKQSGVPPVQRRLLPAEHCPQVPPGWQAGVVPPHSLSPVQVRQLCRSGSQTGVGPPQSASAMHGTQLPVGV